MCETEKWESKRPTHETNESQTVQSMKKVIETAYNWKTFAVGTRDSVQLFNYRY